jgi:hypothetical protein
LVTGGGDNVNYSAKDNGGLTKDVCLRSQSNVYELTSHRETQTRDCHPSTALVDREFSEVPIYTWLTIYSLSDGPDPVEEGKKGGSASYENGGLTQ